MQTELASILRCGLISEFTEVVSSGGAPTPAGTSVFSKHNWDISGGFRGGKGGANAPPFGS